MSARPGLFAALRYRDFRLLIAAFTLSDIGTWGYNVALAVWIYDATASTTWLAAATVCRFAPALIFSSYAGVIAERYDKARFMRAMDLVFLGLSIVMALVMTIDGEPWAVLVVASLSSTVGTTYLPAAAALTPHVVPERDLSSANALRNTIDNVTVIAGPALGGLLVLLGPPENVVWFNSATFLASAVLISLVRTRAEGVDTTEGGQAGQWAQVSAGFRTITHNRAIAVMVGYSVLATAIFGVDTVLYVAMSDDLLGTGPDGYGYLLAGLGVGGVLAAPLVSRAEALPAIGPVILAGMLCYTMPTLLLLISDQPAVAFAVQVVRGAATMFVDVLAITALQRAVPNDVMARVFGVFDTLCLGAILLGSLAASWALTGLGLDATIWISGAGFAVLSLLGLPVLLQVDRAARARREGLAPRVALLERCHLVEQVSDGALTVLADGATEITVAAGEMVIRQGDPADAFYVIIAGRLGVSSITDDGRVVTAPSMTDGAWFGELGLLERVPRTATVVAETQTSLLRLDGEQFLAALTESRPTAAFLDGAAVRLRRTHPAAAIQRRGLDPIPETT